MMGKTSKNRMITMTRRYLIDIIICMVYANEVLKPCIIPICNDIGTK